MRKNKAILSASHTHQDAPGPRGAIKLDDAHNGRHDPLHFLLALTHQYGDLVQYPSVAGPVYLVNHPDYIGRVLQSNNYGRASLLKVGFGDSLFTTDGAPWRRQRRLMQPAFHHQRIAALGTIITNTTLGMLQRWQAYADFAQPINVASDMACLTLSVISKVLFSVDLSTRATVICEAITTMTEYLGRVGLLIFPGSYRINPSRHRQFHTALQTIDDIVYEMINDRRHRSDKPPDLLSMLLLGQEQATEGAFDDHQLRDEIVTILLAGNETTANLLAWTWYLLSEHPTIERRLHTELAQVLGGHLPTVQHLPRLPYCRMILQEALRLYPPGWFIGRKALVADNIGGYHIPANAAVVVSPYTMHRHPAYWENPEAFMPERFSAERSAERPSYTYLPFGVGRHTCIGNHLAMTESLLVLATVAQRYRLRLVPGQSITPEPLVTLRQNPSPLMTLEECP